MKIKFDKRAIKNKELWLEFGYMQKSNNNWYEMLWYNEGRIIEIGYFIKAFFERLFKPNMYFLIRYRGLSVYLRG